MEENGRSLKKLGKKSRVCYFRLPIQLPTDVVFHQDCTPGTHLPLNLARTIILSHILANSLGNLTLRAGRELDTDARISRHRNWMGTKNWYLEMPRMRVTMLQMPAILPQMWVLYLCPKCRYICPKCGQLCPSSAIQEAVRARTTKSFTPDRIEKIPLLAVDPRKIHSENRQVVTLNLHGSSVILRPQNCRNFDTRSTVPRPFGAMEELVFCCPSNYCLQRDPL